MRKIIVLNIVSIDGYFASNNDATFGMDWFKPDPEVDKASHEGSNMDTLLLGSITFEGLRKSWTPFLNDPNAPQPMQDTAKELTAMNKVVFSTKLKNTTWDNTTIFNDNLIEHVTELKKSDGKDILIMGSGNIIQQLANADLIDEYDFIVTPVVAGQGKQLFKDVKQTELKLLSSQSFDSGNILIKYEVIK